MRALSSWCRAGTLDFICAGHCLSLQWIFENHTVTESIMSDMVTFQLSWAAKRFNSAGHISLDVYGFGYSLAFRICVFAKYVDN